MFKSRSSAVYMLRGVLGFGLLAVALLYSSALGWWALPLFAVALLSFGGCPTCWIIGLMETLLHRKAGPGCVDGSC